MKKILVYLLTLLILAGCSSARVDDSDKSDYPDSDPVLRSEVLLNVYEEPYIDAEVAYLDYSQIENGYFGVCLKQESDKKIKLRVIKDEQTYTYDVKDLEMKAIPLQMGDGTYTIKVFEQVEGTTYALMYAQDISVKMEDELSVYLYPNQTVDYEEGSLVIDKSFEVTEGDTNDLDRLYHLYVYVLDTLKYDNSKAKNVMDIYVLPDLDEAITTGKGICFDYAALLAALCRIQKIPARVIVGYTDIEYHAWVEIYLENTGWINPKLYFNSEEWSLVDPTFDDSGGDYEGNYDEVYHY